MQNNNGWLVLYDGDTLPITIKIDSIQEVAKHYIEERNRSYLCYGDSCNLCHEGIIRRIRYIMQVIYRGETLKWEVSGELHRMIRRLAAEDGEAKAVVSRIGSGKATQYQVRNPGEPIKNKYTSGKYGHMVRQ
jgi:hypothetical protein